MAKLIPHGELYVVELRAEGAMTYTFATRHEAWLTEASIHCMNLGPRTAHCFHWGKREVGGNVQWVLLNHSEVYVVTR